MKGERFFTNNQIIHAIEKWLADQDKYLFQGLELLYERSAKCISLKDFNKLNFVPKYYGVLYARPNTFQYALVMHVEPILNTSEARLLGSGKILSVDFA